MRRCYNEFEFDLESLFGIGPRRRHQRKHRRFKWRIFERGDLKFVILRLLSDNPMHGYEVMKALEKESGGYYNPSPGSVYPTLQMLEDEGYLESAEKDGKKVYSVTDTRRHPQAGSIAAQPPPAPGGRARRRKACSRAAPGVRCQTPTPAGRRSGLPGSPLPRWRHAANSRPHRGGTRGMPTRR